MGGIFRSPSQPQAPDPMQTARTQADMQFRANAVNQQTPYGSLTYQRNADYDRWMNNELSQDRAYNESIGQTQNEANARALFASRNPYSEWTAVQTLSPAEQRQLDLTNQAQELYGQAGVQQLQRLQGTLSQPFQPTYGSREAATQALLGRLAPQFDQQRDALETRLANQGIALGSQAWRSGMDDFQRGQNDAYLGAVIQGGNEASAQLQRDLAVRNQPYNELAALLSGQAVQNPNFVNTPQTQVGYQDAVAQNYAGQMAGYQQKLQQQQASLGALAGLGGAALGGFARNGFSFGGGR